MSLNALIPLKHSLKQNVKFHTVSDKIIEHLKLIPDLETQKISIELINYICNLIEYLVKHKYKINKENLFIFTLKRVVELSDQDEEIIKATIKYLHENKLIKIVSKLSYILEYSKNVIKKQL